MSPSAPPPPAAATSREAEVRRYHVVEAVGRGGFGTVYRAELMGPSGFRKQVALKVLNPDLPEAIGVAERLRDEARLLGMLRHRAIVQVDGLHLLNGRWTVVMEFVEGVDLKQLLAEVGPLPPGLALEIVQEVANALHYAYELSADRSVSVSATRAADGSLVVRGALRLMHRDIKPGNIQLTAAGEVKVLDFGVARADFADREARTQSIYFGSLNYMAPERLDGIDEHRGDVYALGAVLYELLLGEPFGRTSANRERHDERLRQALHRLWESQPDEDLYRLVAECLLYDPAARPTARELERACRDLRPRFGAPWLSDWAEEEVPALLLARPPLVDDLSGATLIEAGLISGGVTSGAGSLPATTLPATTLPATTLPAAAAPGTPSSPRPARPAGGGVGLMAGVAAASALLVLGVGGLVAWRLAPGRGAQPSGEGEVAPLQALGEALEAPTDGAGTAGTGPEPAAISEEDFELETHAVQVVPTEGAAPSAPAASAPAPSAPAPSAPAPSAPAASAPAASAPAASAPAASGPAPSAPAASGTSAPSPSAPPSSPAPLSSPATSAAGDSGTVRLISGAGSATVRLVGAAGSFPPGRVPVGRYTIEARFGDGTVDRSGSVEVKAGATVKLSCSAAMHTCVAI